MPSREDDKSLVKEKIVDRKMLVPLDLGAVC